MRTARLVEIGRMECEEIEIPPPQKGQVMIRSEMASICGSDLHRVMMGALMEHQLPCPHGYPGHEGIGMVVESHAEGISEGTHVLVFPNPTIGECFSEFQRVDGCYCLPLPSSDLPRSHLLMAQQLGTVIFAMKQYPRDVFGKTVAVIGQGSAGLFWTYLLKQAGAEKVIVSDLSDARLSMANRVLAPFLAQMPAAFFILLSTSWNFPIMGSTLMVTMTLIWSIYLELTG